MRHILLFLTLTPLAAFAGWDTPEPLLVIESETSEVLWQTAANALWVDGRLLVADYSLNRVVAYGPGDGEAVVFADEGDGPGLVRNPVEIRLDPNGDIAVGSQQRGKVDVFRRGDGSLISSHHLYDPDQGMINLIDVAWDGSSRLDYSMRMVLEDAGFHVDFVLARSDPDDGETVLASWRPIQDRTTFDETGHPPFRQNAWLLGPDGGLWCPMEHDRASEPFTSPVPGVSAGLRRVGPRTLAAVYDEEETYLTAWGQEVRGPCILVVRYDD